MKVFRAWLLLLLLGLSLPASVMAGDDDEGGDDGEPKEDVKPKSCLYTAKNGAKFDLSGMALSGKDYTGATPGGFSYQFNVCHNTNKVCNKQPAPASKWRGGKCNNLGDYATQSIKELDASDPNKGIKISFTDGDICKKQQGGQTLIETRQVAFDIECDPSDSPGTMKKIVEHNMCTYTIQFTSKFACPTNSGMSRGWLFIILLLVGGSVYLGGGIALKRYKFGLTGVEAVPNIELWRQLPGLVQDGIGFTARTTQEGVAKVQEKMRK